MLNNTEVFDADLNPVLAIASNDDLSPLVEYLEDKFSESLTLTEAYKEHQPNHSLYSDLIAKEIRAMGGNSFANTFRGEGPSYLEIACDVADNLKVPHNKKRGIESVENAILEKILEDTFEKMSEEQRAELRNELGGTGKIGAGGISTAALITIFRAGGFKSYQLTLIVANQIAKALLGRGLTLTTNAALTKTGSILAGPVGIAISAIWTAYDLAGPAYKVTIPSVIHIAMLRKKLNADECTKCGAFIPDTTAKFCAECGNPLNDDERAIGSQ